MNSYLTLVEGPLEEPLTVAYVRDKFLRGTNGTAEDDYISRLIKSARRKGEWYTNRAWMPQTWERVISCWPSCRYIELPLPPLIEVMSVTYTDVDGVEQTIDDAAYTVSAPRGPHARRGRVTLNPSSEWPTLQEEAVDPVRVRFRAGYVDGGSPEAADVPEDLQHGALLLLGEMYKQRSESVIGFGVSVNPALVRAKDLWHPYKVY